jgi:hypothetical protein
VSKEQRPGQAGAISFGFLLKSLSYATSVNDLVLVPALAILINSYTKTPKSGNLILEAGCAAYSGRWNGILVGRETTAGMVSVRGVAMKEASSSGNWNPASLNAMPTSLSLGKTV